MDETNHNLNLNRCMEYLCNDIEFREWIRANMNAQVSRVDRSFVASMRRRLVKAVPSLFRWLVFGKPKHFMEFARGE